MEIGKFNRARVESVTPQGYYLELDPEILYNIRLAMQAGDDAAVALALQNDLEAIATRLHPEIGTARRRLEEAGCLGVSMSGSGATVFGIVRGASEAECIARKLSEDGLWAVAVETVR